MEKNSCKHMGWIRLEGIKSYFIMIVWLRWTMKLFKNQIMKMIWLFCYMVKKTNLMKWKKAYGTNKLYARKNVLKQWFAILKSTNKYYKIFEDTIIDNIITKVDNVIKKKQSNPIYISDKDSLKYEKGIGSNVAAVQKNWCFNIII